MLNLGINNGLATVFKVIMIKITKNMIANRVIILAISVQIIKCALNVIYVKKEF